MTRVTVDEDEWNRVKEDIGQLKRSNKITEIHRHEATKENLDLTNLEKAVLEYLKENPGASKQAVVDGLKSLFSRAPVFRAIKSLVSYKLIVERKDNNNRQTYNLFIDSHSLSALVIQNLDCFELNFFSLLKDVKTEYENSYQVIVSNAYKNRSVPQDLDTSGLVSLHKSMMQLVYIFYEVMDILMFHSVIVWPEEIQDEYALKKLYSIVFTRTIYMHAQLHTILRTITVGKSNPLSEPDNLPTTLRRIYSTQNLLNHVDAFKNSGMEKQCEPLIDSFWQINHKLASIAYPEPSLYNWNFDYERDDWKKLLKLQKQHPDETYRNYISGQGNTKNAASDATKKRSK
jgi:Fe2+ or Zn2+ uptake regulation protein